MIPEIGKGWLRSLSVRRGVQIGRFLGSAHLYRTTDGGKAWHEVTTPIGAGTRLVAVGVPRFFGTQVGVAELEVDEPERPGHYFAISQSGYSASTLQREPSQRGARDRRIGRYQPKMLPFGPGHS